MAAQDANRLAIVERENREVGCSPPGARRRLLAPARQGGGVLWEPGSGGGEPREAPGGWRIPAACAAC